MLFLPTDPQSVLSWSEDHLNPGEVLLLLGTFKDREATRDSLALLQQAGIVAFGAWFERIIYGTESFDTGCMATIFRAATGPVLVPLADGIPSDLSGILPASDPDKNQTAIVFVDPSVPDLPRFFHQLYAHFGNTVEYIGGGSGVEDTRVEWDHTWGSLFTTESGFAAESALVALVDHDSGIAARHGWKRIHGPLIASRVDGETVQELNWRPAWEVYREAVEEHVGKPLDPNAIREHGVIGFPFGMKRAGAEDLVRLPTEVNAEGGLYCVGGIPTNAVLHLLGGYPEQLVDAAHDAAQRSVASLNGAGDQALLMECVTRYEFLDDLFVRELEAIEAELLGNCKNPLMGVLARGELSSMNGGYLEMLNKTAVVGTFAP